MSSNIRNHIWILEKRKQKILEEEETTWSLKSRALWLREGDKNTKCFHRFANKRREANAIWEIMDELGNIHTSQEAISREAVKIFKKAYNEDSGCNIEDIVWGIDPFPAMFDECQNIALYAEVSEEELLTTMKTFQTDKCPRPDGWTIDFFIHFFELFKSDILKMVEESQTQGFISQDMSSTYIALIPKK